MVAPNNKKMLRRKAVQVFYKTLTEIDTTSELTPEQLCACLHIASQLEDIIYSRSDLKYDKQSLYKQCLREANAYLKRACQIKDYQQLEAFCHNQVKAFVTECCLSVAKPLKIYNSQLEVQKRIDKVKAKLNTKTFKCRECKGPVLILERQLRSADEGSTLFLVCMNSECKHEQRID